MNFFIELWHFFYLNVFEFFMDKIDKNKIILFSKQPGRTSFSSLWTIKHALNTTKVGHTGTLDSFASGLLVVCTGSLTRLAGRITEFNKKYLAVIQFGTETDTLEYTGKVVYEAPLPSKNKFLQVFETFKGELLQVPPAFSAIHIDGKRASDIARSGNELTLLSRKINVYESRIIDISLDEKGFVKYALVEFLVSKGTYIRSLARDIGIACNSRAHLLALRRTKVGDFNIEDSCGFEKLSSFTIENACLEKEAMISSLNEENKSVINEEEKSLQLEVVKKSIEMDEKLAVHCGFGILKLKKEFEQWFFNGGKLSSKIFYSSPFEVRESCASVFKEDGKFAGLLQKDSNGYFKYAFVQH